LTVKAELKESTGKYWWGEKDRGREDEEGRGEGRETRDERRAMGDERERRKETVPRSTVARASESMD
jgi:hypothetical protein